MIASKLVDRLKRKKLILGIKIGEIILLRLFSIYIIQAYEKSLAELID